MGKIFRPSTREASILSRIESSKGHRRRLAISTVKERAESVANSIAMKLVDAKLIETTSKTSLEEQITRCLEKLGRDSDFDVDYQVAPLRNLVPNPNIVSLYVTSFVLEKLIDHKDVVDIYGSDEEIYFTINRQVEKALPV